MVWIHPSWILLHGHQEDVLLFVGGVQREDAHHDEVREEEELGKANTLIIIIILDGIISKNVCFCVLVTFTRLSVFLICKNILTDSLSFLNFESYFNIFPLTCLTYDTL